MRVEHTLSDVTEAIVRRIRGEYSEMPGLRVTQVQAQRLWALDETTCCLVLDSLVEAGFLRRTDAGHYVRLTEGPATTPPLRMAKATLSDKIRRISIF